MSKCKVWCCVPLCISNRKKNPELSFHKFPTESKKMLKSCTTSGTRDFISIRSEWMRILGFKKPCKTSMLVCSKHFKDSDYVYNDHAQRKRLGPYAVPSLFPTESEDNALLPACENDLAQNETEPRVEPSLFPTESEDNAALPVSDINNTGLEAAREVITREIGLQVCSGDLQLGYLIKIDQLTDAQINSLTGVSQKSYFYYLVKKVSERVKMTNRHHLPLEQRVLLTFMRMKMNITYSSLSVFFGCSVKTVSNIFRTLVPILSSILGSLIEFQSKDMILANMPTCFRKYKNVCFVLDCTEVRLQKSHCLTERIDTYSQYYGEHTLKYMLVVSPGGVLTYVSCGFGGRVSDKFIFEQSKLIEMLEPHVDAIMVDKGFLIEEYCAEHFIELVRPPFLRQKEQFSASEALKVKHIAKARVHVERAIQRVKLLNILKGPIPLSIAYLMDDIIVIAAALANFSRPILASNKYEYEYEY